MKQPDKLTTISVQMEIQVRNRLAKCAKVRGLSMASFIRTVMLEQIKVMEADDKGAHP